MENLHASLDSTCKRRISKISHVSRGFHSTTFDPKLKNERFTLISFMGFSAILSALQQFQICIFNRKDSRLTLWNGPQLMEHRSMANLHTTLDSIYKSRISKNFSCLWGVHSNSYSPPDVSSWGIHFKEWAHSQDGGSILQFLVLSWEMKDLHWYLLWGSCNIKCITSISNLHFQ